MRCCETVEGVGGERMSCYVGARLYEEDMEGGFEGVEAGGEGTACKTAADDYDVCRLGDGRHDCLEGCRGVQLISIEIVSQQPGEQGTTCDLYSNVHFDASQHLHSALNSG